MVEMILGATPEPNRVFRWCLIMPTQRWWSVKSPSLMWRSSSEPLALWHLPRRTCAGEHHGGRVAAFARDGNDADQQERDDHANNGHGGGLPERNAETERPRAVRHGEHGNIGSEPGPKQTGRRALTLLFGYGVDTLLLDGEGPFSLLM